MALASHPDSTSTEASGWPPGTAAPAAPAEAAPANEAVTRRAFLLGVQKAIKGVPAAWVRCELHKVSAKAKLTELELVETDGAGAGRLRAGRGAAARAPAGRAPTSWLTTSTLSRRRWAATRQVTPRRGASAAAPSDSLVY